MTEGRVADPRKNAYPKRHNDDGYADELRIVTRERYKTSGLSGDEWRFHRVLQMFRKGRMLFERPFNGDIAAVASFAPLAMAEFLDGGLPSEIIGFDAELCFQPGCPNPATSTYEIIEEFGPQGQRLHPEEAFGTKYRKFCQKHLRRGDCSREDCDANYRLASGYGPDQQDWDGATVREAARRVVEIDSVDELPDAIQKVMAPHNEPSE
jgi:hypothetical protein